MNIKITDESEMMDLVTFVIKIFDSIKCASATSNNVTLHLNKYEVDYLADHIRKVDSIEIHEE